MQATPNNALHLPPTPAELEYFTSMGGGFDFNKDSKTAAYGLTVVSNVMFNSALMSKGCRTC